MNKIFFIFISLVLLITACASTPSVFPARLYDLSNANILHAQFEFSGTTRGSISFTFPSGEKFTGEYQTISGGSIGWGNIYGSVWGPLGYANVSGSRYTNTSPTEYKGTAVMTNNKGTIITCEYISNTSRREPHGQGVCKDNKGKVYKLMY